MKVPLGKKLKKRAHLELALLQDEVAEIFYTILSESPPILHGGTAIWRCYGGNRFSEDLDFYGTLFGGFRGELEAALNGRGLSLAKYKEAPHVTFAKISSGNAEVKLEVSAGSPREKVLSQYEKADGSLMDVYTLKRDELIEEKMKAYLGRRFIRDIYDVYFLGKREGKVKGMGTFLKNLLPPVDERNLRTLIYSGLAPTFAEMKKALGRMQ